ncbi:MAG: LrgB family protein [Clostridiales bacterium]|jgi:predicted murein hydrolase (TIGR00659 family)|nr:LrgB family protein [Clostridiales bacterium]
MSETITAVLTNGMFGIMLSVLAFQVGVWVNQKWKLPFLNPLLIGIVLTILILKLCRIPIASYQVGGDIISMFLAPATTVLAYSIYQQIQVLKKYFIPVLAGCLMGSLTSMFSAWGLCKLFGLGDTLTASMIPKSVTTPIAMEVSQKLGGIPAITVAAVLVTGVLGAALSPVFVKIFRIKSSVAAGVAIGTCSHAAGTSKAIEMGEIQGAMGGIAIGVSGLITVIIALFL